jgi:hypothetical protein
VKTKSVVMGVRGTDFVTKADPGGDTEVHLLTGELEVNGTALKANEVVSSKGGVLGKPAPFPRPVYMKELGKRQPGFVHFSGYRAIPYWRALKLKDHPRKKTVQPGQPEEEVKRSHPTGTRRR